MRNVYIFCIGKRKKVLKEKQENNKNKTTIKKRLFQSVILLQVVGIICINLVTSCINCYAIYSILEKTMKETAQAGARATLTSIQTYLGIVREMSTNPIISSTEIELPEKLSFIQEKVEYYNFEQGGFINEEGIELKSGMDVSNEDYFKKAIAGEYYITEPITINKEGKLGIVISAPVYEGTKIKYVLSYVVKPNIFSEISGQITMGSKESIYILSATGNIIAHQNETLVLEKYNAIEDAKVNPKKSELAKLQQDMIAGNGGFRIYKEDGIFKVIAYAPLLNNYGWSIAVVADAKEYFSSAIFSIFSILILTILAVFICTFFLKKISENIVDPIKRCIERIQLLAQGDLFTGVEQVNTRDETQDLTESTQYVIQKLTYVVDDISFVLGEIAKGNLNVDSKAEYKGSFLPVQTAIKSIVDSLNKTMNSVDHMTYQVKDGSGQVAQAAQSLAEGVTNQATAVEQLSATMNQIAEQVESNTKNIKETEKKLEESFGKIEHSSEHMHQLMKAMDEIRNASKQINLVIDTVEEIASQTDLLALNASIEAARAGEAGKGFHVVAFQVRNLANHSMEAVKNMDGLVGHAIQSVQQGIELTQLTAMELDGIVENTKSIKQMAQLITNNSIEQTQAIQEINYAIDQIANVVENNAAAAQEAAASSQELFGEAELLKVELEKFTLKAEYN